MKRLTCEMCGSTDLLKDGGVFVCQSCGCKYTVEEARKMMIEGTVDIRGTVRVDNTELVQKYLENARRAKAKEDWQETEKYYNLVEQNAPENIEAIFYSAYGKAKMALIENDIYKRKAAFNVLQNCISTIDDKYEAKNRSENQAILASMASDLVQMLTSSFVYTEWKNGYGVVTKTDKAETYQLFVNLIYEFRQTMLNIQRKDPYPYYFEVLYEFIQACKKLSYEGFDRAEMNKIFTSWLIEEKDKYIKITEERREAYWREHEEERKALEAECSKLEEELRVIETKINEIEQHNKPEIEKLMGKMDEKVAEELEFVHQQEYIRSLETQYEKLGIFKMNEKKKLLLQLETIEKPKLEELRERASNAKKNYMLKIGERIEKIENESAELRERSGEITERIVQIGEELTRDR